MSASRPVHAAFPQSFQPGTAIVLDPAGPLYAALSASLRPYVQGTDDVNHAAISNLVYGAGRDAARP